jgi:hypothetical protein
MNEEVQQLLGDFTTHYKAYARKVYADMSVEMPSHLRTMRLFRRVGLERLAKIRDNVHVTSDDDLDKLRRTVSAIKTFMSAAEYLDDRQSMLGHAPSQMQYVLEHLGLLAK